MKKLIKIGDRVLGNGGILIQTMTNTKTADVTATVNQINRCAELGADLVRFAVPDIESAGKIREIKKETNIPLIADIHFDYKLALLSIDNGIDKIRINPGNIKPVHLKEIARAASEHGVPVRIGVNAGSLNTETVPHDKKAEALVNSCLDYAERLEEFGFDNLVLAVKSSNVKLTVEAYRLLNQKTDYPLHVGVTEAGTPKIGLIKSYTGIGSLLLDGIGDTIRISLTDTPEQEVIAARNLLRALNIDKNYAEVISCPTCARCNFDLFKTANEIEDYVKDIKKPLKIAVMGCVVNGPGEAKDADIGLAGGDGKSVIFKNGKILMTVDDNKALEILKSEIDKLL